MTTIDFGGGPTVDQRRSFAGLKGGAHVPGYRGYCPQIKYRVGKTYGQDTHELAGEFPYRQPMPPILPDTKGELAARLPDSTGDNKYTKSMVPGYTGYIPRMNFRYGGTYKEDCDACIGEHVGNMSRKTMKDTELNRSVLSNPRMGALQGDPAIKHHLNTYRDTHPERPLFLEDKRSLTEPPMPGYQGYVPRINTTELGLGCRYHQSTKNGLDQFQEEQALHRSLKSAPVVINRTPAGEGSSGPSYMRRLYPNSGMIPKYTGYVPQRRYHFGNTYGDTTRSLEICHHNSGSFGDFMKTKPKGVTLSLA